MAELFQLWLKMINSETKECHALPSWVNIESITIRHIKKLSCKFQMVNRNGKINDTNHTGRLM